MRYTVKKDDIDLWSVYLDDEWISSRRDENGAKLMATKLNSHLDAALNAQTSVRETKLTREEIALAVLTETMKLHSTINTCNTAISHAFDIADAFIEYRDKD